MSADALYLWDFVRSALRHGALALGTPYEVYKYGTNAVIFVDCA